MISENALKHLKEACEYGQVFNVDELKYIAEHGTGIVWERDDAVLMTVIEEHFIDGKLQDVLVIVLGGGNLQSIVDIEKDIEQYARKEGYPRLYFNGRKGWMRVINGYKEHTVSGYKDLTNG